MLAHSVMNVVIVPDETINQGTRKSDGLGEPKSLDMGILKTCHRDESIRKDRVKRGKPLKLETQIMVGELSRKKRMNAEAILIVDK